MKFLCVACDEPMKLTSTTSPQRGTLSVVYACPRCSSRVAMLTNPAETQLVQSLGVRIGPKEDAAAAGSKCPFAGMLREMEGEAEAAGAGHDGSSLRWTDAARVRLQNVPDFVRPMAKEGIETFARSRGYAEVDERVMDEAKSHFGM